MFCFKTSGKGERLNHSPYPKRSTSAGDAVRHSGMRMGGRER